MDTQPRVEILKASLEFLSSLAWPTAVVFLVYLLRVDLRKLLAKMRLSNLKYGSFEMALIETQLSEAKDSVRVATKDIDAALPSPTSLEGPLDTKEKIEKMPEGITLGEMSNSNPSGAILLMWELIEQNAKIVVGKFGITGKPPLLQIDSLLSRENPDVARAYRQMREVRNLTAHALTSVTPESAREFVDAGGKLIVALQKIPVKRVDSAHQ